MNRQKAHEFIDSRWESYLPTLSRLVAMESVSGNDGQLRACAEAVQDMLARLGFSARVCESTTQPMVLAEMPCPDPGAPTILFYGHYDVMPPGDLSRWHTPPFEATVKDGRIWGRGAADCKGQWLCHLIAVEAILAADGHLPCNVKLILDGDEETGSPSLEAFVRQHADFLRADMVYTADSGLHPSGAPMVIYGVRGSCSVKLRYTSATKDNHSGAGGGVVPEGAVRLVQALSSLWRADGTVAVEGFYEDIEPPSDYDWQLIEQIPFDIDDWRCIFGVPGLDLPAREFYRRLLFQPSLTLNGIHAGCYRENLVTAIPGTAEACISMRLPARQDPLRQFERVKRHLEAALPGIEAELDITYWPSRTPTDLPIARTVAAAIERAYGRPPVQMPLLPASGQKHVWTDVMQQPSLIVPYANADENNHVPNENITLECWKQGMHASTEVLYAMGEHQK